MKRAGWTRAVQKNAGFTVVEVLVTITIAAVFIAAINQLHITQSRVSAALRAYEIEVLLR